MGMYKSDLVIPLKKNKAKLLPTLCVLAGSSILTQISLADTVTPAPDNTKTTNPTASTPTQSIIPNSSTIDIEDVAKTKVSISIKDGFPGDIARTTIRATTKPKVLEIHRLKRVPITLEVKDMEIGKILEAVAVLGGCHLYILPDRFLIAPSDKPEDYSSMPLSGNPGQSANSEATAANRKAGLEEQKKAQAFSAAIYSILGEMDGIGGEQARLKDFSPRNQQLIQKLVDEQIIRNHMDKFILPPDTQISVSHGGGGHGFTIVSSSQPKIIRDFVTTP